MHFASVISIVHRVAVPSRLVIYHRCRREPLLVIIVTSHPKRCGYTKRCGQSRRAEQSARVLSEAQRLGSSATDVTWRSHLEHGSQVREPDALSRARSSSWPSGGGARFALTGALTWSTGDVMARFSLFLFFHFLSFSCSLSPSRPCQVIDCVR